MKWMNFVAGSSDELRCNLDATLLSQSIQVGDLILFRSGGWVGGMVGRWEEKWGLKLTSGKVEVEI